jgi:sulfur-oxidizing protein SoxX
MALLLAGLVPAEAAGDAARGQAIVNSRSQGLCLLCHRGPGVPVHLQGSIAPDLAGAGSRFSADELRQRLREPQRFNPETIMPAYGQRPDLQRVAPAWRGKPLLDDGQIEDVVAYLLTLR